MTTADATAADAAAAALATACGAVSAFEEAPGGVWRVEGFTTAAPQRGMVEVALALAWASSSQTPPTLAIESVPPRDWLGDNQASFPPMHVGRFVVHGSHHRVVVPPGRIGLLIDAATAFGTGEHATTRGCLMALQRVAKRGRPRRLLDMGSGTGILAIAAARTWRRCVLARDIDAEAVRVTAANAARNGVAALVRARRSTGFRDRGVRRAAPYDLIFANILACPLAAMAPELAARLAPGGMAILSGLLANQEAYVLAAYRLQHLVLAARIALDGWHTLLLRRPDYSLPPRRSR